MLEKNWPQGALNYFLCPGAENRPISDFSFTQPNFRACKELRMVEGSVEESSVSLANQAYLFRQRRAGWPDAFLKSRPKCSQKLFCQNYYITFTVIKSRSKILALFNLLQTSKSKHSPNRRNSSNLVGTTNLGLILSTKSVGLCKCRKSTLHYITPLFLRSLLNSDSWLLVSLRFTKRLTCSRPALLSMLQAPLSLN
jgi:hypothetical protein